MMTLVIDTNVLVSALLSPHGPPAAVLRLVVNGAARMAFDERIMQEYWDVLKRPDFPFRDAQIDALLGYLEEVGLRVTPTPLNITLVDPDDLAFVEVALSARADCIVTGNKKHFQAAHDRGVTVFSPAELIVHFGL
jgi:putative PIN family toxin of toxin-antitoxin system